MKFKTQSILGEDSERFSLWINKDTKEDLVSISKQLGYPRSSVFVRLILQDFIDKYKKKSKKEQKKNGL